MSWLRQIIEQALHEQHEHNHRVEQKLDELKEIIMSDQDTINQIAANVDQINSGVQTLSTSATDVEAELAALITAQQNNQPLDFSALQAKVATLQTNVGNVNALLPDPGPQGATGATGATGS